MKIIIFKLGISDSWGIPVRLHTRIIINAFGIVIKIAAFLELANSFPPPLTHTKIIVIKATAKSNVYKWIHMAKIHSQHAEQQLIE